MQLCAYTQFTRVVVEANRAVKLKPLSKPSTSMATSSSKGNIWTKTTMLATANPLFSSSSSSFLLQTTNTSPTKLQSLATPFATLSIHKKPTLVNLSKASRFLGPVGFSLTKLLVQYSCLDLPAVLQIEVGELFSFSETFCQTCCAYYVQIHISM